MTAQTNGSPEMRMAANFIDRYGKAALTKMLEDFLRGTENTHIALRLGVTRQRVHQWRRAFTRTAITVKPKISELLK